jgi:hypothetical protein
MILSTGLADFLAGGAPGNSLRKIFEYGVLALYGGAIPADANHAETGTLAGYVTVDGGVFTPGNNTNGLVWEPPAGGICPKESGVIWAIIPIATVTLTWARLYTNSRILGASTLEKRIDFTCGAASGDIQWSSLQLIEAEIRTIDVFNLRIKRFL